ncbi:NPCBM/NEW2 domain-containing protein [Deinococcus sp.]|uniref:NPCBM/NEW2 domain-containing protein n=1 Tax=Deinococcus sp. TaxID=47478 RepID=UPI003C7B875C
MTALPHQPLAPQHPATQHPATTRTLPALFRRRAAAVLLLGTALLSACSGPANTGGTQPGDALAAKYPYLPGVDYSWTDTQTGPSASRPWVGPTIRAQGGPTDTYLSDMTWTSAANGYGPVELNRSNGEAKGGDGGTLTIGGVAYAKGLGLHANSDVLYSLGGNCSTLAAQVGVDDEVGNNGSVVFQLWSGAVGSGTKLYDSGKLTGADTARAVSVNLSGVSALHLVVTDAGDGGAYDHADWADAKITCTATAPSGDKFLSDLNPTAATNGWGPVEKDQSNGENAAGDGRPLSIRGVPYQKGLGTHASASLSYALGSSCSTFSASVGLDDEVKGNGSVNFAVYGDGDLLYNSGKVLGTDSAKSVNVSVSGMSVLRLEVSDGGDGASYDHADWGNAKLTCSAVTPKITAVGVTPNTASMTPGSTQQFTASIEGQGAYDAGVTWSSSNTGVVTVSSTGLATAQTVGSATITATSTFDTSKSGSSAVTVGASSALPTSGVQINFQPSGSGTPAGFIADTGAGYSAGRGYGWVTQATAGTASAAPLDLSVNTRDRATGNYTPQLNTFVHMQYGNPSAGVTTPGAWEYALPSGTYTVTVAVGDAANNFDSSHTINIEGKAAISAFVPTDSRRFFTSTLRVPVTDGKLTIDAAGGSNTKLDYVIIAPGDRPSVRVTSPQDAEVMVNPNAPMTADVNVVSSAIDLGSLTPAAVQLIEHASGTQVAAQLNTSGGGDVVVLQPAAALKPNTVYDFKITGALKDTSGLSFLPTSRSFVTGSATTSGNGVAFEQVAQSGVPNNPYTAVEIGPDNKLYAATLLGKILRFNILADGTLGTYQTITSVTAANGGPRTIIGMKFDPASTADNLIMWISNNYFWDGKTQAPDWSGKISRLSGPDLGVVQDYVVDLPRSIRDHQTNSIAFKPGEPNVLYITQGSNNAMGAPDDAWGNRPERLLNAAVLRLDLSKLSTLPLSVKTEEGGLYNPYAKSAPLTLFASGVRNAYDLVWHSNGQLYTPTNGSAAGGNTPGTPANLSASTACQNRIDGPYTAPAVPALSNASVESDYLFRVVQGGYYGHPNPARCEWVMDGGNPTAGADSAEAPDYPVGTLPDRNYRGYAYDFGLHASPNGVIEEYTLAGNTALRNKLMVVRYSAGKDIIILTPGGANNDIIASQSGVTGLTGFNPSPLDLTENRSNGNLYVAQLDETSGGGTITLVRPK